jgi:hypothetical protein
MKKILSIVIMGASIMYAATLEVVEHGMVDSAEQASVKVMDANTEEESAVEHKEVKVKDGGVEYSKQVEVIKKSTSKTSVQTTSEQSTEEVPLDKLNSKVGVILAFKNNTVDIKEFEARFELKLKEKLVIGYYIFENVSSLTDVLLVSKILASDMNNKIETIRPNWPLEAVPN